MQPTLSIIGVGPGDPNLLTLKAARTLENCPVIISPKGSSHGRSTALGIAGGAVNLSGKEIHEPYFPMKKIFINRSVDPSVQEAWQQAARLVLEQLRAGKDVAFPTLGDPAIYSTGYYLFETILALAPETKVRFIPGIPAMSSCSAATRVPVCLGDEMLAVIPATFGDERIRTTLTTFDTIVLMKVNRVLEQLVELLTELNLLDHAVLVERAGMEDERVIRDLTALQGSVHYFSTIIVRKNSSL